MMRNVSKTVLQIFAPSKSQSNVRGGGENKTSIRGKRKEASSGKKIWRRKFSSIVRRKYTSIRKKIKKNNNQAEEEKKVLNWKNNYKGKLQAEENHWKNYPRIKAVIT